MKSIGTSHICIFKGKFESVIALVSVPKTKVWAMKIEKKPYMSFQPLMEPPNSLTILILMLCYSISNRMCPSQLSFSSILAYYGIRWLYYFALRDLILKTPPICQERTTAIVFCDNKKTYFSGRGKQEQRTILLSETITSSPFWVTIPDDFRRGDVSNRHIPLKGVGNAEDTAKVDRNELVHQSFFAKYKELKAHFHYREKWGTNHGPRKAYIRRVRRQRVFDGNGRTRKCFSHL